MCSWELLNLGMRNGTKETPKAIARGDAKDSSVQFRRSIVSDSLRPHELQHARPPCPSPTPRVHSDSLP